MEALARLRRLVIAWSVALLVGCTGALELAYNNGDWFLRLAADAYLGLDREQRLVLKDRVERLHDWHRQAELPQYAGLAAEIADRLERGLDDDDVGWMLDRLASRYRALAERAAIESAPLLARLDHGNLAVLERKLEKSNAEWQWKKLRGSPQERERQRLEAVKERIETWTGSLSAQQEALLLAHLRSWPRDPQERRARRLARQQEFLALVREHQGSPDLAGRLQAFLLGGERERGEWDGSLTRLVIDLDGSLTPEQRRRAVTRLDQLAATFSALAGRDKRAREQALSRPSPSRKAPSGAVQRDFGGSLERAAVDPRPARAQDGVQPRRCHGPRLQVDRDHGLLDHQHGGGDPERDREGCQDPPQPALVRDHQRARRYP